MKTGLGKYRPAHSLFSPENSNYRSYLDQHLMVDGLMFLDILIEIVNVDEDPLVLSHDGD